MIKVEQTGGRSPVAWLSATPVARTTCVNFAGTTGHSGRLALGWGAVINLLIFLYYPLCLRVPLSPSEPTTLKLCPARLHG